jgi:hypothetical protein
MPGGVPQKAIGGIRGLSAVPSPSDAAQESLLFIWTNSSTNQGCMYRLELSPPDNAHLVLEVCLAALMSEYLNGSEVFYTLGAYNRVMPIADPSLPAAAPLKHLIGFAARVPCRKGSGIPCAEIGTPGVGDKATTGYYAGGVFFIRSASSRGELGAESPTYALNEIGGRRPPAAPASNRGVGSTTVASVPALVATRTYVASPFAVDRAVFFGGYDCNDALAPTNTAWVFRGSVSTVLAPLCCGGASQI